MAESDGADELVSGVGRVLVTGVGVMAERSIRRRAEEQRERAEAARAAAEQDRARVAALRDVDRAEAAAVIAADRQAVAAEDRRPLDPGQRAVLVSEVDARMRDGHGAQWAGLDDARTKAEAVVSELLPDEPAGPALAEEAAWRNEMEWSLDPGRRDELGALLNAREGEVADQWVDDGLQGPDGAVDPAFLSPAAAEAMATAGASADRVPQPRVVLEPDVAGAKDLAARSFAQAASAAVGGKAAAGKAPGGRARTRGKGAERDRGR